MTDSREILEDYRDSGGWNSHIYPGQFGFYVVDEDFERAQMENRRGSVYVITRDQFDHQGTMISRSTQRVAVNDEIEVGLEDLIPEEVNLVGADLEYLGSLARRLTA